MRIGVPREVKPAEFRVGLTAAGVAALVARGHEVVVESGAGVGSGVTDDDYAAAGASLGTVDDAWSADLVVKVKEPVGEEHDRLRPGLLLFTFLHLAADEALTRALIESRTTSLAYETVRTDDGRLPLLAPMSDIAGRLAPQVGAEVLLAPSGGRGVLLGGTPGVPPGHVVVLGAGAAGTAAVGVAVGLGARVTVLDLSADALRAVAARWPGRVATQFSTPYDVERVVLDADLVIGAVLVPGARAPKLISTELVSRMRPGSVLVDIAVDQGGCFEGTRPTTHEEPTYAVHDSLYYCVANMPGAVPVTSTAALTGVTLPYVLALADKGWRESCAADPALAQGLSTVDGLLTSPPVGAAHGLPAKDPADVL